MTDKYIDLADRIEEGAEYSNTTSFCLGIECALRWLDEHPDQAPGQTITESEMDAKWDEAAGIGKPNFTSTVHRFTQLLGFDVIPDPEPTNAEKLAEEIRSSFNKCEFDFESSFEQLAKALDARGVKAPGGDDD